MQLPQHDLRLFFKLHAALMCFVNLRLTVIPNTRTPGEFAALTPENRVQVRDALNSNLDLIESFVDENSFQLSDSELDIVSSWRHLVYGKFFIIRGLKNYTVFLSTTSPAIAYGVQPLSQPFKDVIGPNLPVLTEAVLLPFKNVILYDSLLRRTNVSFGAGLRRDLNNNLKEAKERCGIVTSLPMSASPVLPKVPKAKLVPKHPNKIEKDVSLEAIIELTDQFCKEYLTAEYAELCRRLAGKLARKRPSPLISGKPKTWACGILRTIGWVNFLDDISQTPHMKLTFIDKVLGVGESTGQGKSMLIRKIFKIRPMEPEWTLRSQVSQNPMAWMIQINGFQVDARSLNREIQEEAFRKGLIPYIPESP